MVPIGREADEGGVDGVVAIRSGEQDASALAQLLVERPEVNAAQEAGYRRLSTCPAAPDLGHDAAMAQGCPAGETLPLHE
ncbi:MAG: hypothetical protein ACRD1K_08235, partial [Acidimicrobiales bacterium]